MNWIEWGLIIWAVGAVLFAVVLAGAVRLRERERRAYVGRHRPPEPPKLRLVASR